MAAAPAASDYAAVVQQLYISYFGRPADFYGVTSFEAALLGAGAPTNFADLSATLQAGTNAALNSLVNSFSSSSESTTLYGTGTDTISISKFVNAIYSNVLNRDADLAGLNFWVGAITSGALSQADAAVAITEAALTNTTAQGKIDAAVVTNKVTAATDFTADLTTTAQINGYSGDAAAAAARALLSTVTDTTDLTAFQGSIASTLGAIVSGTGTITSLTVGEDDFTGTSANDIFTAPTVVSSAGAIADTLTSLDVIDGGAGVNTLKATLRFLEAPTLSNIENVQVRFVGGELNLGNSTGVTNLLVANSTTTGGFENVGAVTSIGLSNQISGVYVIGDTAKTLSLALDTFGNTTDISLSNSYVNLQSDHATTVNLTTNNSVAQVFADTQIKTLTVAATGANEIYINDSTAITSATITGTGSLFLDQEMTAITKFDASANSGGVIVQLGGSIVSALGSSGDDQFVLFGSTAGKTTVNLGDGDDRLVIKGTLAAGAVLDGGTGANTLVFDDFTNVTAYSSAALFKAAVLDFQTLEVNDGANAGLTINTAVVTGFTSYVVDAGSVDFQGLGATTALTVQGGVDVLTLENTAALNTAGTAAVTLTIDNQGAANGAGDGLTISTLSTEAASLTIHSNGLIGATDLDNNVTLRAGISANLTNVVIDGSQAIEFHTGALTALAALATPGTLTVDASTATGSVSIDAAAATAVVNINGGSAADVLTAGTVGGAIYGGAGGDSITLGAGVDTVVYKAVTDSVYSVTAAGAIGAGIDTIHGFTTGTDKIDLTGLALTSTSVIVDKTAASLSALTTLAATSSFYNDSTGTARSIVEVTVGSDSYLFIDANKDHKFDASTDLVIKLAGVTSIAASDLIFG